MAISDLNYEEVDFAHTALRTVVCELRFNPILRIGVETPVEFQDQVRRLFPKFAVAKGAAIQFRVVQGEEGDQPLVEGLRPDPLMWRFQTEDDSWTATLSSGRISLETLQYTKFPDFAERFAVLHSALQHTHPVDHFTRVGLRYINVFESEKFPGPWRPRFNERLIGPMADEIIGNSVLGGEHTFVLQEGDWAITVRHGSLDPSVYTLDFDHASTGPVEQTQVESMLRAFNQRIYQVFRWSITDSLYSEMEPTNRA